MLMLNINAAPNTVKVPMMGGAAVLPEYGPPDAVSPIGDPALELPDSNIGESEWRRAIDGAPSGAAGEEGDRPALSGVD